MIQLSAQDAVSPSVLKVSADMGLKDLIPHTGSKNYEVYAVFSEVVDKVSAQQFLGIVPKHMVGRYPNRIFADLLPFSKSSMVEPSTSLDILYAEFQRKQVDAFSVMDAGHRFIGAVTPRSLFQTLWEREQVLTARLQKEIAEKLFAENELEKVHSELEDHLEKKADFLLDHKKQLMDLSENLISTEKRERHALAGELHDHLAQILALGRIKLAQCNQLTEDAGVLNLLKTLDEIVSESLTYTRTLMTELNSAQLHQFGLLTALESLAEKMKRFGLEVGIEAEEHLPDLSENQNFLLYWSVRELLFNVVKHAHIQQAMLAIRYTTDGILQCVVSDNGRGFEFDQMAFIESRPGHLGLSRIKERMNVLGGSIRVKSSPGHGTQVTLTFSLAQFHTT